MSLNYLVFALLVSLSHAFAGTAIISDFDDTIKRSNIVDHGARMVGNVPLYKKLYIDMPDLLEEMNQDSAGTYIISASPKIIYPAIRASLKTFGIEYKKIFTRGYCDLFVHWPCRSSKSPSSDDVKVRYKVSKIESVLKSANTDGLILLGDNIEADHKVYMLVEKRNPGKVKSIYIRKVREESLPKGINGFYTAFDVAVKEYEAGRFSFDQVKSLANTILDIPNDEMYKVIAYYGSCPTEKSKLSTSNKAGIEDLEVQVSLKIINYCKSRKN